MSLIRADSTYSMTAHMKGSVDHIICDPPFLSEDCQTKGKFSGIVLCIVPLTTLLAALTVRWLMKPHAVQSPTLTPSEIQDTTNSPSRLIVCTGERMEVLVNKLYRSQGVKTTTFEPVHAKGLSNEFYCYANFECEDWKWDTVPQLQST